jgi:hypothetical protein
MKTFIIATLVSFSSFAADFDCRYFQNLNEIYQNEVTIADGAKDQLIADFEEYRFFITSLRDGKYELQALNVTEPSRTYATARLSSENPELGLVIWKREGIIEVKCSLK